jgi:hypothetical protein
MDLDSQQFDANPTDQQNEVFDNEMKFHMKKKPSQKQKYCQKMFP